MFRADLAKNDNVASGNFEGAGNCEAAGFRGGVRGGGAVGGADLCRCERKRKRRKRKKKKRRRRPSGVQFGFLLFG